MKKEEGFSGNISAGSGAGNHFFQRPLYHVLKALFSFFIDVMRSDGFAVCPFGDDAADGSGFQSQHGTKCEKGGIFHFIIRTSDMPEIFQRTLQPFQYIAAEAVIPFLSRPEAVGADGNPRFERDARFLCRFAERKNRIRVGYRRKFDGGVCAGSAVHADRCRIDDYIAYRYFTIYGDRTFSSNRDYTDQQRFGIRLSYQFNATKSKYKGTGAGASEKSRL